MMGGYPSGSSLKNTVVDVHTEEDEALGKIVWQKTQDKSLTCENTTEDDFRVLGEYYMGQMTGTNHPAINGMIMQMVGKEGEEEMHAVMGKQLSGCDVEAKYPSFTTPFLTMMQFPMTLGYIFGNTSCNANNPSALDNIGWFIGLAITLCFFAIIGLFSTIRFLISRWE